MGNEAIVVMTLCLTESNPELYESFNYFIPSCQFEDSTNCIWLADKQGNKQGDSFIDIENQRFYPEKIINNQKQEITNILKHLINSKTINCEDIETMSINCNNIE